ncbi:hypothetical protein SKAU_G00181040 [Synaphobranchus kaupii]|uniref:Major facilitator superfamily (MFS) profile domain-containing protein n=1 Tax=Synaphobranchus kaupii TaxID=118154 RepID=A0A9Q1FMB0_SYNKA|nr:hypothetical protein SKAU_G00181040 [Synaphobranchus kaupii]
MNRATATIFFIGVMIGAAVFGVLSDRFGRKSMLLVAYLSSITFGLASIAVLGKATSEASVTTAYLYTTELYPTVVRQNGMGYTAVMARLGVSIAPLIALLEDVWKLLPELIFCTMAIISGLVACLLPETKNVRLPETIEDIEQSGSRSNSRRDATLKPLTSGGDESGG